MIFLSTALLRGILSIKTICFKIGNQHKVCFLFYIHIQKTIPPYTSPSPTVYSFFKVTLHLSLNDWKLRFLYAAILTLYLFISSCHNCFLTIGGCLTYVQMYIQGLPLFLSSILTSATASNMNSVLAHSYI